MRESSAAGLEPQGMRVDQGMEKEWTEKELDEDMPQRTLNDKNPQAAQNLAYFSFKDRSYKTTD